MSSGELALFLDSLLLLWSRCINWSISLTSHAGKVFRAAAECTRSAVTRAWVRMWRFSAWKAARSAAIVKPLAQSPAGWVRDQDKRSRSVAVEDDGQWQRNEDHQGRQQKGIEMASLPSFCAPSLHVCMQRCNPIIRAKLATPGSRECVHFCCTAKR